MKEFLINFSKLNKEKQKLYYRIFLVIYNLLIKQYGLLNNKEVYTEYSYCTGNEIITKELQDFFKHSFIHFDETDFSCCYQISEEYLSIDENSFIFFKDGNYTNLPFALLENTLSNNVNNLIIFLIIITIMDCLCSNYYTELTLYFPNYFDQNEIISIAKKLEELNIINNLILVEKNSFPKFLPEEIFKYKYQYLTFDFSVD